MDALEKLNQACVEVGVCETEPSEKDIDCLAVALTIHILEHEATGAARLINPVKAKDPNVPCKCFGFEDETYCWKPGYLGLISSKRNPEQMTDCRIKLPSGAGVAERFKKVKGVISEAQKRWEKKGGTLPEWWEEVAKSLEDHKIEL